MKTSLSRPPQPLEQPYRQAARELTARLVVNGCLAVFALVSLVRLGVQTLADHAYLHSLNAQVVAATQQVQALKTQVNTYTDPQKKRSVMEQLTDRVETGQIPIYLPK